MSNIPDKYLETGEEELISGIRKRKRELGKSLVVLGHNYQRLSVYRLTDFQGDSYGLSKIASEQKYAKFIVFCGVKFMAETAAILCSEHQIVQHPVLEAGCPMADMADIGQVKRAWEQLAEITDISSVIPVTYMNSDADLKAFCGDRGGIVCTSSNAEGIFDWAFKRGEKILFFPDEHLGRNTASSKGIAGNSVILWNPEMENGGNSIEAVKAASVILWKGFCHVHQWFSEEHIRIARKENPDAVIIIHPEGRNEIVDLCDLSGSTGFIEKYCANARKGAEIIIGTEINMVQRLALEYPDKKILPLNRSLCPNMYKINLPSLAYTLDNPGEYNVVSVPEEIRYSARLALRRMLEVSG